jgi:hypothetical protein
MIEILHDVGKIIKDPEVFNFPFPKKEKLYTDEGRFL